MINNFISNLVGYYLDDQIVSDGFIPDIDGQS